MIDFSWTTFVIGFALWVLAFDIRTRIQVRRLRRMLAEVKQELDGAKERPDFSLPKPGIETLPGVGGPFK